MAIRRNYTLEQDIENSINDLAAKLSGVGQDASGIVPTRAPVEPQIQQDGTNYKQDTGGIIPDNYLANVEKRNGLAMESAGLASIIDESKLAQYVTYKLTGKPTVSRVSLKENVLRSLESPEYSDIMTEALNIFNSINFDTVTLGNYSEQDLANLDTVVDEAVTEFMVRKYKPSFDILLEVGAPRDIIMEAAKKLEKKKTEVKEKIKKRAMNKNVKVKKECGNNDLGLAFGKGTKQECGNTTNSSLPSSSTFANRA